MAPNAPAGAGEADPPPTYTAAFAPVQQIPAFRRRKMTVLVNVKYSISHKSTGFTAAFNDGYKTLACNYDAHIPGIDSAQSVLRRGDFFAVAADISSRNALRESVQAACMKFVRLTVKKEARDHLQKSGIDTTTIHLSIFWENSNTTSNTFFTGLDADEVQAQFDLIAQRGFRDHLVAKLYITTPAAN